jgi:hypothetical protein
VVLFLAAGSLAAEPTAAEPPPLTCDAARIDPKSYRLTTRAVALAVTTQRYDFWDRFEINGHVDAIGDLNDAVTFAAQRAAEIDPANQMAHGILARQFLIVEERELAEGAWRSVMKAGGSVVWTATLYDVDARSYFFMAFSRDDIRIYRFSQMTREFKKGFYSIPEFPGPEDEKFWAAGGGCIDPALKPEAVVPWSTVREIKSGNWVLYFKLTQPITVTSDRNKKKTLKEIKVALHGRAGTVEAYDPVGEEEFATRGRGPAGYQDLVRRVMVKFVDPEKRIALPPSKPGVGW